MNNKKEQKNENIQVFVRVRPVITQERLEKCGKSAVVVSCSKDREIVVKERMNTNITKTFKFDRVFSQDSKQIDVYRYVVNPLIEEVLAGYNCTVFTYGQTGTGKTYTMEGERSQDSDQTWEKDPSSGIVPRVLSHIFDELRMKQLDFTMSVSYLELYNEELIDLLSPVDDDTKLRLFEDATQKGSLVINGLQEILVLDKKEVYDIMNKGSQKRQTGATLMNARSSRSHTIFTVTVHIRESTDDGEDLLRTGKINLVDLAGSENIGRSGAKQQRAREAGNINQSLLTLGRVITALVEKRPHIPYRESKLTRLLQDSLGGRTKTSIIATISPVLANLEETLSTLDYAHRAKSITNRPEINQLLTKKALLKEYGTEIERLRRDLEATRDGTGVFLAHENYMQMMLRLENQDLEISENIQRIRAMEQEREKKEAIFDRLSTELQQKTEALAVTHEKLQRTEEQRDETSVLLDSHVTTEQVLGSQAAALLQVADQSTTHLQRVHDKLDRKRSVEQQNVEAVQEFREFFGLKMQRIRDHVMSFGQEQNRQINTVRLQLGEALQSQRKIEATSHEQATGFLESHGDSLQALEAVLRVQAQERKLWSQGQMQAARDSADSQVAALSAALDQAHSRISALTEEVQLLRGLSLQEALRKIETHEKVMKPFLQQQMDMFEEIQNRAVSFSSQMDSELARSSERLAALVEHRETTEKLESDSLAEMQKLIESTRAMRAARREEERRKLQQLAAAGPEQSALVAAHVAGLEQRVARLDKDTSSVQAQTKDLAADVARDMRQVAEKLADGLESVVNGQTAVSADMQAIERMLEKGWQDHAAAVEQEMRSYAEGAEQDVLSLGVHLQDLREKAVREAEEQAVLSEARDKSLSEYATAGQAQLQDVSAAAHEWNSQHAQELHQSLQEVTTFLSQGLKKDAPTGATPQRCVMEFPRILKATSPHERILERFRAAQQQRRIIANTQSLDSVVVLSSDQDSLPSTSSYTSLSPSRDESIEQNKENGSTDLIKAEPTESSLMKATSLDKNLNVNSKRKVLANQNF